MSLSPRTPSFFPGVLLAHTIHQFCGGAPVIRGTRVRVKVILDNLAEGHSIEQIVDSYPGLRGEDVQTVIAFAAAATTDDVFFPVPEGLTG